jgi:hypothetical protein
MSGMVGKAAQVAAERNGSCRDTRKRVELKNVGHVGRLLVIQRIYIQRPFRGRANLLQLVANLQHDLPAGMTGVRLRFGLGRVGQRKTLGNGDLDFLLIDQPSDFGKLSAVRFGLKG